MTHNPMPPANPGRFSEFVALPRDTLLALADAAFLHVQKLFSAHRVIVDQIKAAADINALNAIDIVNHEAWTA